jgi:hypothetical protein
MIKRASLVFLLIATMIFSVGSVVHAQTAGEVAVTVMPANPGPNAPVTITLSTYSFNLATANITWTKDGAASKSGIGMLSYTFTTKALGAATTIFATIVPAGGVTVTKTIAITPMSVDILWQATDSIVPPFYRGKAMATSESAVKFVAIPQVRASNGLIIAPSSFAYDWSENYTANASVGGYGKNSYTSVMDYLNPEKVIQVSVSGRDGSTATTGSLTLDPSDAKLLWYASSPLYGPLFGHALDGTYTVKGSDTSIIAEPYFFSPGTPNSPMLKYAWTLNDNTLDTPNIPNSLFLHRDSSAVGTATLSIEISSVNKLFQDLTANLTLNLQ